jgi:hypothetical protein
MPALSSTRVDAGREAAPAGLCVHARNARPYPHGPGKPDELAGGSSVEVWTYLHRWYLRLVLGGLVKQQALPLTPSQGTLVEHKGSG